MFKMSPDSFCSAFNASQYCSTIQLNPICHLFHLALNCVHVAPDVNVEPLELVKVQVVAVKHLEMVMVVVIHVKENF